MTATRTYSMRIATDDRMLVSIDDFTIAPGRITVLLGESGIGKSLIAKTLYGLLDPDELTVTINGMPYRTYLGLPETRKLQEQSFFVFQEPSTHLHPLLTLQEQLNEGSLAAAPHQQEILQRLWQGAGAGAVESLLPVYPKPYRPSGGEKQRMLIAMAFKKMDLVIEGNRTENALFVFDEPSGSLDNFYRDVFLDMLFERYRRCRCTILLITHDYSMIGMIHQLYPALLSQMTFKELMLVHDGVRLRDFEPREYLQWRDSLRPIPSFNGQPIVTIQPEMEIHGRRLIITGDPRGAQSVPLVLRRGSLVYLKAPSGVGKTTLAKTVMGLVQAERFAAQVNSLTLDERTPMHTWRKRIWGRKMTLVFQHADEALNLESSVRSVFAGLPSLKGKPQEELLRVLRELFDEFDEGFLNRKVKHLSGGQKQRLNLLRGFALDCDVLILDEPLNGLDFESAGKVIGMIQRKQASGKALLLISHNEEIFDRVVTPEHTYYLRAET